MTRLWLAMQIRPRKQAARRNPRGSCIECFRRKKKCDKDQPCYNCTRRYPPVECVYQKLESLPEDGAGPATRLPSQVPGILLAPRTESSSPSVGHQLLEEIEQGLFPDTPPPSPQDPASAKTGILNDAKRGKQDVDVEYARFQTQIVTQKFAKQSSIGYSIGCGTVDLLRMLSVEGTNNNARFFEIHSKLMTRYDYSIDGSGKVPELYENAWMPFTINSPILLHLNLLKAAIAHSQPWLPKTNFEKAFLYFTPPSEPCNQAAVIRLQLQAVSMLKARLRSPVHSVDDESIAAACYMIYLEWTWNDVKQEFNGLMPHVQGMREMLRQRGGLDKLGQSSVLAMVVMLAHYHLAINLECDGFVCPTEFLRDKFIPDHEPMIQGIDSPLWISSGSFAGKVSTSDLSPLTAQILDWMSFLTTRIRSSVLNDTSEANNSETMHFATRTYEHLCALPSTNASLESKPADFVYEAVRLASVVYNRAILSHIKLSESCEPEAISALLEAASRTPLRKWKEIPGVWIFILLVANAGARFTREGRLSRALMRICSFSIALRDWQALVNLMESFLAVQKWIAERGSYKLLTER